MPLSAAAFDTSTADEPAAVQAAFAPSPRRRAKLAPDLTASGLESLAVEIYGPMGKAWMHSANPRLGGRTPLDTIRGGQAGEVRTLLEQIRDTVDA